MKLYECPTNTIVRVKDSGEVLHFFHIDGMYSYCEDVQGNPVHLAAWTDVVIDSWKVALDKLEKM